MSLKFKNVYFDFSAVGRPMKKKFTSNHVVRRVSSKVIETENRQFYKLIGDLHNAKHGNYKKMIIFI